MKRYFLEEQRQIELQQEAEMIAMQLEMRRAMLAAEHRMKMDQAKIQFEKFKAQKELTNADCPDGEVMVNGICVPKEEWKWNLKSGHKKIEIIGYLYEIRNDRYALEQALDSIPVSYDREIPIEQLFSLLNQFVVPEGKAQEKFYECLNELKNTTNDRADDRAIVPYSDTDLVPMLSEIKELTWVERIIRKIIKFINKYN